MISNSNGIDIDELQLNITIFITHTHISWMHSILLLSHVANHSICAGNNVILLLYLSFVCQHYTSCIFLSLFIFYKMLCWNIRIKANIKWIGDTDFFATNNMVSKCKGIPQQIYKKIREKNINNELKMTIVHSKHCCIVGISLHCIILVQVQKIKIITSDEGVNECEMKIEQWS